MKRALILVAAIAGSAAAADSTPRGEVLSKFVGSWRTEAIIRNYGPPLREIRSTGRAESRPTLEGRYVEFRTMSIEPPGVAELQVMTYDTAADEYRQWVFDSDGYRHEARGRWHPATSTLRWETEAGGARIVIDDRWVSSDRLEWTLTRTGRDGRLTQRIDGVVAREPGTSGGGKAP